jgi:hypothetical protein
MNISKERGKYDCMGMSVTCPYETHPNFLKCIYDSTTA